MNMQDSQAYTPGAMYFHDSDCVEYVKVDSFVVYDRIDEFLTLIYNKDGVVVGFKLKGFKHIFTQRLSPIYRLNEGQFLRLATAIEAICMELGEAMFDNERRAKSYRVAYELAANDNVKISDIQKTAKAA